MTHGAATAMMKRVAELDAAEPDVASERTAPAHALRDGVVRFCGHALHVECYDTYFAARETTVRCLFPHSVCCQLSGASTLNGVFVHKLTNHTLIFQRLRNEVERQCAFFIAQPVTLSVRHVPPLWCRSLHGRVSCKG